MTLTDGFTRECLAIRVARPINSLGVQETMADVMLVRGIPEHIRSDKELHCHCRKFTSKATCSALASSYAEYLSSPIDLSLGNTTIG